MTTHSHQHDDERADIGCLKALEMFYAYIDGELGDAEDVAEFEHHIEHCRSCYSRAELEGILTERLKAAAAERASEDLKRRMRILLNNI